MNIKKILTFSIFLLSALIVSNQINASEGINLSIVQDESAGPINPTLYIYSADNEIYTSEQGYYFVIKDGDQKVGLGDFYLSDYPELFGGGIYKIQFHNVTNYESTGVFYEVANVSHISVTGQNEYYIFKIYDNNSHVIGTQELYEGRYKIDFVTTNDNLYPVINGKTDYITNVNNPISESDIKAGLYAIDNVDGNIPSTSFVLVSDGYTANKNILGTYDIVYKVSDSAGNESQVTVKVHVVDVTKPIISGQAIYNTGSQVQLSEATIRAALTAVDAYDGSLVVNLLSDGYSSNYTIIGSHTIVYKATDSSGNVTEYSVTINVYDDIPPFIYTNDAFINIDGNLNYTLQQIIDHLINVGDLQASVNFDNYYVSTSDYDPSTPGQYEVVLMRSDLAPESLKERVSIGIRVLETNPIPTNPDPTTDDSSNPVDLWPYFVGTFIAGIFIIAFINRKKR